MKYKAILILSRDRYGLNYFYELEHYLNIDDEDNVTEDYYIDTIFNCKHEFNPPRVWDKNLLVNYKLIPID